MMQRLSMVVVTAGLAILLAACPGRGPGSGPPPAGGEVPLPTSPPTAAQVPLEWQPESVRLRHMDEPPAASVLDMERAGVDLLASGLTLTAGALARLRRVELLETDCSSKLAFISVSVEPAAAAGLYDCKIERLAASGTTRVSMQVDSRLRLRSYEASGSRLRTQANESRTVLARRHEQRGRQGYLVTAGGVDTFSETGAEEMVAEDAALLMALVVNSGAGRMRVPLFSPAFARSFTSEITVFSNKGSSAVRVELGSPLGESLMVYRGPNYELLHAVSASGTRLYPAQAADRERLENLLVLARSEREMVVFDGDTLHGSRTVAGGQLRPEEWGPRQGETWFSVDLSALDLNSTGGLSLLPTQLAMLKHDTSSPVDPKDSYRLAPDDRFVVVSLDAVPPGMSARNYGWSVVAAASTLRSERSAIRGASVEVSADGSLVEIAMVQSLAKTGPDEMQWLARRQFIRIRDGVALRVETVLGTDWATRGNFVEAIRKSLTLRGVPKLTR